MTVLPLFCLYIVIHTSDQTATTDRKRQRSLLADAANTTQDAFDAQTRVYAIAVEHEASAARQRVVLGAPDDNIVLPYGDLRDRNTYFALWRPYGRATAPSGGGSRQQVAERLKAARGSGRQATEQLKGLRVAWGAPGDGM
ncbi:hypothetical protein GUJ93_ZPchr0007g5479 [Zizania palustris]|uniref:Uncharacterized protein n=1 Tax=Zizania palustris TaxID=103762 RepID=A0A8J5TBE0_ZIZPA|nr:hypothetical protein GUJ93_ZPchr0007g5479 [Zizania palustris]